MSAGTSVDRPRRSIRRIGCWIAVGVIPAAVVAAYVWSKGPPPHKIEQKIRDEVPLGTSREDVERYLRSRSVLFYVVQGPTTDAYGQGRVIDMAGFADAEVGSTIRAHVEPAFVDLLFDGEVTVYFFFDHHSRLIGYAFHPWVNAL